MMMDQLGTKISIEESPSRQEIDLGETQKQTIQSDTCYEHVRHETQRDELSGDNF